MAVFIALGANQDAIFQGESLPPQKTLAMALQVLDAGGVHIEDVSHAWQSPAWPDPLSQPAYINAAAKVTTDKTPLELLTTLKEIECSFGRKPSKRNAPRPLDLDVLDYDGLVLDSRQLILPHPRMCTRSFVLFPLQEIAPNWKDPVHSRALLQWIARLSYADVKDLKRLGRIHDCG